MLRAESRAWLGLLGRAVWGGVSVSLVLAALVLLAAPAEAANEQTGSGSMRLTAPTLAVHRHWTPGLRSGLWV